MRPDPSLLDGLIASVADGWPQDWGAVHALSPDEGTRRAVSSLRTVAAIAELHRGVTPRRRGNGTGHRPTRGSSAGSPREDRSAAEEVRPAPERWGRFVLLKKLGEGGFGDVYQAHDTQLDRDVALKLLRPRRSSADPGEQLLREARMLARVRHPNVASVYGAGVHEGRAGLWMELVRGANLEELLQMRGPMSACEAALVGIDVCRALAAVHAAGLVHRDVKASNVLREVGGRIVLTDFGSGSDPGLGPRRRLAGTPLYLAPEVLAGSEATVQSDLYSLGVVLFRMVTDSYPRRVLSPETPFDPGHVDVPTSLRDLRPDLPDAFVAAVELSLAADPDNRPSSAGAFRSMLGLVLGVPTSWRRVCRAPRPATPPSRTVSLGSARSKPIDATAGPRQLRESP
jgi:serine/threonine-protein kinase